MSRDSGKFLAGQPIKKRRFAARFLFFFFAVINFLDFGVAPKALEGVKLAGFLIENINDDVAVIHQHPVGGGIALDPSGFYAVVVTELEVDFVRKGLDVAFVAGGGDY